MHDARGELLRIPKRRSSQKSLKPKFAELRKVEVLRACFAKLRVEKKLYALRYEKDLSYRSL